MLLPALAVIVIFSYVPMFGIIVAFQDFLAQASEHALCPGEEVEILCGAMKHVSGKVKKIKKNHLVLYLEQLGATVCVKLDDVARVDRLK